MLHHTSIAIELSGQFAEVGRRVDHLRLAALDVLHRDVLHIAIVIGTAVKHTQTTIDRQVLVNLISRSESETVVILATTHERVVPILAAHSMIGHTGYAQLAQSLVQPVDGGRIGGDTGHYLLERAQSIIKLALAATAGDGKAELEAPLALVVGC